MICVLRYIQKLALVYWLGEMLFFISIFAPRVFKVLPRAPIDWAAKLQANIFPAYFTAGVICAVVLLITTLGIRWLGPDSLSIRQFYVALGISLLGGLIFYYCRVSLTPKIAELQEALAAGTPEFKSLHMLSVRLNGAVLLGLFVLLGLLF